MADEVTLSAAVRSSLLALSSTTKLIERTQNRLSTGLEVASPIDDPVRFFQAKSLSDRAADFDEKKQGIDQGISTVTAALDGIEGIEDIVGQLKGLALNAKSATSAQIGDLVAQFNDLRNQIANLASDSAYQGVNLINSSETTLSISFSVDTASVLDIQGVNVTETGTGLGIRQVVTAAALTGTNLNVSYDFGTNVSLSDGGSLSVTYAGQSDAILASGTYTFEYGSLTVTLTVGSAGATAATYTSTQTITAGATLTYEIGSEGANGTGADTVGVEGVVSAGGAGVSLTTVTGQYVIDSTLTTQINALISDLDTSLETLRSKAQTLGSNVALLQTRLEFTESYVSTLQTGADKLTLADLNEEGANLLALQTRQQLGIQALSFAGQAEQSILGLFS